jgi:hypothetical protein
MIMILSLYGHVDVSNTLCLRTPWVGPLYTTMLHTQDARVLITQSCLCTTQPAVVYSGINLSQLMLDN